MTLDLSLISLLACVLGERSQVILSGLKSFASFALNYALCACTKKESTIPMPLYREVLFK